MSQDSSVSLDQIIRTTQIIIGALIAGVTTFLVIVVLLVNLGVFGPPAGAANPANNLPAAQPAQTIPILTYVSAGMGVVLLLASFSLPNVVAAQVIRAASSPAQDGTTKSTPSPGGSITAAHAFRTSAIIAGALVEAAAFFAGCAYLLEQNPIALVVCGVLLAALVLHFPTRGRIERWIAQNEEKLRYGAF
jgi:hypothetical protein